MSETKFSKTHEWVKIDGQSAVIGITDFAQKELGDVVFVELPRVGDKFSKEGRFGTVESTKAASELYIPVGGEIIGVNNELNKSPQLVNESAQDKGWMIKIKLANAGELKELMDESAYKAFIATQKH
jgi:glycine cleavage system H protein